MIKPCSACHGIVSNAEEYSESVPPSNRARVRGFDAPRRLEEEPMLRIH